MGYGFQLVALPIEQLAALHACRDSKLVRRVLATPGYVQYLLGRRDDADEERRKTMERAVHAIIGGAATMLEPHLLAYAVEACCFALGTPVGNIDTRDVDRVEQMLDEAGGSLPEGLFPGVDTVWPLPYSCAHGYAIERGWPRDPAMAALFPDPGPGYGLVQVRDYPMSSCLSAADVRARHEALVALPYEDQDDPYTEQECALWGARRVFAAAATAGTDVIVFLH